MLTLKTLAYRAGIASLVLSLLFTLSLIMLSWLDQRPPKMGLVDGKLQPCRQSSNCLCSEFAQSPGAAEAIAFQGSPTAAMTKLSNIVRQWPRSRIVTQSENYLHAEIQSLVFRFCDDVEFRIDPDASLIHFRSASRVGLFDLGVNRQRMDQITKAFLSKP